MVHPDWFEGTSLSFKFAHTQVSPAIPALIDHVTKMFSEPAKAWVPTRDQLVLLGPLSTL